MSSIQGIGSPAKAVANAFRTRANRGRAAASAIDKETFGAQVVSKTLDVMNSGNAASASDYQFQKDVLNAAYTGQGTIIDELG